jgi:hypothetical protein
MLRHLHIGLLLANSQKNAAYLWSNQQTNKRVSSKFTKIRSFTLLSGVLFALATPQLKF